MDRFTKNGNFCEKRRSYRCWFQTFSFSTPTWGDENNWLSNHIFQMGRNPPVWVTFWSIFGFGKALGPQLESSTPVPELVVSWQQCRLVQMLLGQTVLKLLGNSKDVACNMGVSKNRGTPKWMVYNGKPYYNSWFGGTLIFGKHPYLILQFSWSVVVIGRYRTF